MKILREGKLNVTIKVECDKCEALLEIEAKDVDYFPGCAIEDEAFHVICPCCSKRIEIKKEKIPSVFYGRMKR